MRKTFKKNQDLLNRTEKFSLDSISVLSRLPKNQSNNVLVEQCIKAVTSVGANYREACEAESSRDFVHKIYICKKEARESEYWLTLLSRTNSKYKEELNKLIDEAIQLVRIFSTITSKFSEK